MAADERNFRSSYYEKVGFRSVEEKKSLEILLKDKPLDKVKLRHFCLRYTVHASYRNLVWKVLLEVVPIHVESHDFVMEQRYQEYNDLLDALKLMRVVNDHTSKPELYVLMWLLENGKLRLDWSSQIENQPNQNLLAIVHSLLNVFESDVDIYWISKGFFQCVDTFYKDVPKLVDYTNNLLEKEDNLLFNHLVEIGAVSTLPLHDWLCSCFAGTLSETSLGKIWDKVAAGSCTILVFVAVLLLITLRHPLLKCLAPENVLKCLSNVTEEAADVIVNKATEMWQQYGTSGMGPDSLKTVLPSTRPKPS